MKKLFLLIPLLAFAMIVKSEVHYITNSSNYILRTTIASAANGDIIEMAAGTYEEKGDWLAVDDKAITVRAAENAEVVIKPQFSVRIKAGETNQIGKIEFIGVKFDCSALESNQLFVPSDNNANQSIVLNNCEFYDWSKNDALIKTNSDRKIDAIHIDNCYFHGFEKSIIFLQNANPVDLSITNSTFANIAGNSSSYYAAPIDVRATSGSMTVDHCTFYNVAIISSSYGMIYTTAITPTITNCIFAHPSSISRYSVVCPEGCTIDHCLSYNTLGYSGATSTNDISGNPYFLNTNPANYDFSLWTTSPARNAGTDNEDLGDYVRWNTDPSTHVATVNITADDANSLKAAVDAALPGDIIILADGTYEESENIALDKNITIKAADDAHPIVKPVGKFAISNEAAVTIQNIKFDGSTHTASNFIYAADATNNTLTISGCEFYNISKAAIYAGSDKLLSTCSINNSLFYNITNCCICLKNTATANLTVTNSTFDNIDASAIENGIVESKTAVGTVLVDHCTFYNCRVHNTDYGTVKVNSPSATVSNCIFAMPTSTDDLRTVYIPSGLAAGTTVTNCIMHNYTKDSKIGVPSRSGSTIANCNAVNPLFNDAPNADFNLRGGSPARGNGTSGSNIGDPRWVKTILPETDFSTPLVLEGADAVLANRIELDNNLYLHQKNNDDATLHGTATWLFHANAPSYIKITLNLSDATSSGHNYQVAIFDENENAVGTPKDEGGQNEAVVDKELAGIIYLPAAGDYKVVLSDNIKWSGSTIKGITLSYGGGNEIAVPTNTLEVADAVFENGTRADGVISFDDALTGWAKWNINVTTEAFYSIALTIKNQWGHNMTVAVYEEDGVTLVDQVTEGGYTSSADNTNGHTLNLGAIYLKAASYVLKVTNATSGSDAKIMSVSFTHEGGAATTLSLTDDTELPLSEAWYKNCNRTNDFIKFHDSGSPWVKWNISTTETKFYDVSAVINAPNNHQLALAIYEDENAAPIATINESYATVTDSVGNVPITLGRLNLVGGKNYVAKLTNTSGSRAEIINLVFAPVTSTTTELPGTIELANAVCSPNAHVDGGKLYFGSGDDYTPIGQWARFAVTTDHDGLFLFTMNVSHTGQQSYKISIYDNEDHLVDAYEANPGSGDKTIKHYFALTAGEYSVQVENTYSYSRGHVVSLVVTEPADIITLDETATNNDAWVNNVVDDNESSPAFTVQIKRTIKAGMYNTFCLPFAVSDNMMRDLFGSDVKIYTLGSAVAEGTVLNVTLDEASDIWQGTPVFIKTSHDVINPVFEGVVFKRATPSATTRTNADLVGTFVQTTLTQGSNILYLGPDNMLYYPDQDTPIKGMRCWFAIHDTPTPVPAIRRMNIVERGDVITDINYVETGKDVLKTIENGQIVIIRDGVRYNVMGVKLQ